MSDDSELIGTWRAQDIGGSPVLDDVASTIEFGGDGHAAGVNRFGGPYRVEGDAVELGPFLWTRMAGPEPAMRQEQSFLAVLSGRRPFAIDGETLVIGQGPEQVRLLRVE